MSIVKKIVSVLLTLCLLMGITVNAAAIQDKNSTGKTVEYISQNWIESQLDNNAEVSKTVRLYNTSEQLVGYLVSFKRGTNPLGYIVLSTIEESEYPIIEFALEGESIYTYLNNTFKAAKSSSKIALKSTTITSVSTLSSFSAIDDILYTDFINYSIKIEDNNKELLFNQNGYIESFDTLKAKSEITSPSSDTFFNDYIDFPSDSSGIDEVWSLPCLTTNALVMGNMPNVQPGEGNCGPTSLANTVKIYADSRANNQDPLKDLKLNGSDTDTYNRLVQLSGYSRTDPASMSELLDGLKKYCKERKHSCSIDNYWFDNWGDFTRDLKANKPVLLYTSSKAGTAHSQVAIGYYKYKSGAQYLKIFSGWTSNATFVKFKPSSLNNFNGYCVKIT